jgi:hypothetical protein
MLDFEHEVLNNIFQVGKKTTKKQGEGKMDSTLKKTCYVDILKGMCHRW